jgi:hypothetical protein
MNPSSHLRNPRTLAKAGITLVVVSIGILWVLWSRRPEPPPESLRELTQVVGTVESVSEDYKPSYTTRNERRTVVHAGSRQALVLELKTSTGERSEWAIDDWLIDDEAPQLSRELEPGTSVTAYTRDGRIYQLEGQRGVLVDLERARANRSLSSIAALALVLLALVAGGVLCVRAAMLASRERV